MKPENATRIFISYALEDEAAKNKLSKHLESMRLEGLIRTWDKQQLTAGIDWKTETQNQLEQAQIILLLLSADALASNTIYLHEIQFALIKHQAKKAIVIPILIRPCDWTHLQTDNLLALPYMEEQKAVSTWTNQDAAYQHIAQNIRFTALNLQAVFAGKSLTIIWKKADEKQIKLIAKLSKLQIAAAVCSIIIASLAVLNYFGMKPKPVPPPKFSQTVLLRQGKMPFEQKGKLKLIYDKEQGSLSINEGKVSFPIENYEAEEAYFTLEGIHDYELAQPDSSYLLGEEAIILQLTVNKRLLTIKGKVVEEQTLQPIPQVTLSVENEDFVTDSLGKFNHMLSLEKPKQSYALTATKVGYSPISIYYNPKSKQDPIRLKKQKHP